MRRAMTIALYPLLAMTAACAHATSPAMPAPPPAVATAPVPMLPERLMRCTLGRATNIDTSRQQTVGEIVQEGRYEMDIMLPAIPVRQTPPPDATDPAEPVDPRTRILRDTGNLAKDVPPGFDRVIDLWPERVELVQTLGPNLFFFIVFSDIDTVKGTANIFMTYANDAATYDMSRIYLGGCWVNPASKS